MGTAARSGAESGGTPLLTRHLVGLCALLVTIVPGYLASRSNTPRAAREIVRTVAPGDASAEAATDHFTAMEIEAHIRQVAVRYRIAPLLVAAIVEAESEFNPRAVSRRGARGLMQLMPLTASSLQVEDTFDPYENIEGGVRHLRRLMNRYRGNLPLVLAAYNAGEQAVAVYGGVPPYRETRRYVARILRRMGHQAPSHVRARPAGRAPEVRALTVANPARISAPARQALEQRTLAEIDRTPVDRTPAASLGDPPRGADERSDAAAPLPTDRPGRQGP
jgi:transglycosylase-like protein with SLT domain